MKIVVEEEGLYRSLDQVSDYLQKALDAKDRKIKDKYIYQKHMEQWLQSIKLLEL